MFKKVLIANRDEIACRVIRTCKRMGISTVAIYSEADANGMHVHQADEAYLVGPPPASESYLNIRRIIEVARLSGAQAVHPGYGFLSENVHFVEECGKANLHFVGPSTKAMRIMGDKVKARNLAQQAGLPVVPGTTSYVEDSSALEQARQIGFPLMVKAAGGGGGIGIRVVHSPQNLMTAMERARFLVKSAFGSPSMYMEKYLEGASHVEVQVLADNYGNVVHMFERDCSMQRRQQKVVEETPCAKIQDDLRHRIAQAAIKLVRHIGYTNAGTVEFLVDDREQFYFLEMNTRLQVEHPVTEMVLGLDMVELQLRIAAGERLPIQQWNVVPKGHSIEARIYPEDPDTLVPSTGTILEVTPPKGTHVRIDSAIYPRYEVTSYYSPLLAKLIVWAETRDEAIQRLCDALDAYTIRGIVTNIPMIKRAISHPKFREASYDITYLQRLLQAPSTNSASKELVAAIAVAVETIRNQSQQMPQSRWRLQGRRHLMTTRLSNGVPW